MWNMKLINGDQKITKIMSLVIKEFTRVSGIIIEHLRKYIELKWDLIQLFFKDFYSIKNNA